MADIVDKELAEAERDASPNRFGPSPSATEKPTYPANRHKKHLSRTETGEAIERIESGSSYSSSNVSLRPDAGTIALESAATQKDILPPLEKNETAMSRIHTQRTQHSSTVGATLRSRQSRAPIPKMGAGKPYPPALPDREEFVVEFDGVDDPMHAQNWTLKRKLTTSAMLAYTTFVASFASSLFSATITVIAGVFHVNREVTTLGTSLYVLGFAFGPIFWAPLSELKGRRLPLIIAPFAMACFNFAVAVAKDLQTVMICRFFAGLFGSAPLAVVAAVFSDMFDNNSRGIAITVFSLTVFTGPLMAPFIGGFIVINPHMGWRWTEYIIGILSCIAFVLNLFFLKETYPPIILIQKADELRRRTKNWGIHAKQEEIEVDLRELVERNFSRPLRMLVTEPIVLLLSIYMSFIYGLLYLFLTAYPLVFQVKYHMNPGVGGLPFFGMILGQLLAGGVVILRQPGYRRKLAANGGIPIPEWRCPEIIAGGIAFAGGLFWLGWSGYTGKVHWIVPTLSGLLSGFGLMAIFLQALNYLVDSYLMFAASAIAANTFMRSTVGAIFPLFATYMFNGMGINWACTMLGCIALVLVPVPVWFLLKGGKIREKSAYAPVFPAKKSEKEEV
ncbi:major facilitator superfamily transporter [Microthyrium microscopicum]|uniref:Major facilitator superfamily transporter n=1 Tax=Microthyrium microscopicum TaxID=703497 RepID=A0A6A6U9K9_9PEZI|nr:major facilitator superfamily transporter [Microthyrium microscopicum]